LRDGVCATVTGGKIATNPKASVVPNTVRFAGSFMSDLHTNFPPAQNLSLSKICQRRLGQREASFRERLPEMGQRKNHARIAFPEGKNAYFWPFRTSTHSRTPFAATTRRSAGKPLRQGTEVAKCSPAEALDSIAP
jgi:hypothetical protein